VRGREIRKCRLSFGENSPTNNGNFLPSFIEFCGPYFYDDLFFARKVNLTITEHIGMMLANLKIPSIRQLLFVLFALVLIADNVAASNQQWAQANGLWGKRSVKMVRY
jgi:hypothetical protein